MFTQIVAEHFKLYSPEYMEFILQKIYFPMFEKVVQTYLEKA